MDKDWKYFSFRSSGKYDFNLCRYKFIKNNKYYNMQLYNYEHNKWTNINSFLHEPRIDNNITKLEVFQLISNKGMLSPG